MQLPACRPNAFQRLIQRLAMARASSAVLAPVLARLDRAALRLTGGRQTCTSLLTALPTVQVTTWGARSGLPRTTPLVAIADGEQIILVATNFGRRERPAWAHNLRAHPRARVSLGSQSAEFAARLAAGAEAERCLRLAEACYPGYALYQQRAAPRVIDVFVLSLV